MKAEEQANADGGDPANDAHRVDGRAVRARVIGEGANHGVTQAGRIDYALAGGRINTDFIDNSAGVDTSDHEVNLKILLDRAVASGAIERDERNRLLEEATDDVAARVDPRLGEVDEAVDTLGGLAFVLAGQVPDVGAVLTHGSGWRIEVTAGNERHVTRLRLHPPIEAEAADA